MDFFQFIGYIRQFNADVALIGAAVWGLTLLARKTFLKSAKNRKFITFLPFLVGALLYAAYAALCGGAATDWAEALNSGITCGSLATVIEMVYRQFLHGEEKDVRVACVQAMLSGWAQLSDEQAQDLIGTLEQADEERAKAEIAAIYHENKGRYGYRRITMALRSRGFFLNHKTVQRLTRELGLVCRVRIKKYRSYRGEVGKIAPNLLNRDFCAEKPNQKWVTDVTQFHLFGQKLYLSPILDLHNGYLVSYTLSQRPILSMVTTMLEKAFETIPDGTDLILHSDQGWQYQHKQYQRMLRKKSIQQSMSRKGNCLDNAVMENFFGLLKSELLYLQKFKSMEHFKLELLDYLEYYNNRRIKAKLKGLPPAIHRQQALSAA